MIAAKVIDATKRAASIHDLTDDAWLVVAVEEAFSLLGDALYVLPLNEMKQYRKLRDDGDIIVTKRREADQKVVVLAKLRRG